MMVPMEATTLIGFVERPQAKKPAEMRKAHGMIVHVAWVVALGREALDAVGVDGVEQHGGCAEKTECGDDVADF